MFSDVIEISTTGYQPAALLFMACVGWFDGAGM